MARIAVATFQHETNTFAPSRASFADFESGGGWPGFCTGQRVLEVVSGTNIPIEGFVREVARAGHVPVPLAFANATPSAHVEDEAFERVMRAVLDAGADIINDVRALREPGALQTVAAHASCGVCLMHMHRDPQTMQVAPMEGDAVPQVVAFLSERSQALQGAGVAAERIAWDPGIGFGKTVAQNFALLARQAELLQCAYPLLVGWSRKSSLGAVTGLPMDQRTLPSVVAAVMAAERGARIVRVHDVAPTVAGLKVLAATIAP